MKGDRYSKNLYGTLAGTKRKAGLPNLENYTYLGEFFQDEINGYGQYMLQDGSRSKVSYLKVNWTISAK